MSKLDRTLIDPRRPEPEPDSPCHDVELAPGLRIEQYELIRELGRGGMGQVFLARDNRLGRRVAIKFLLAGASRKIVERFLVEARVTASLSHENIVTLYEVDQYLGLPYMVLEYVEGTTLAKLIEGRRVPAGRAIGLVVPVVKALARAHADNIVHRDLKPDNIVVTATGTVKVLDFGVAKLFAGPADPNAMAGTLPYMSPEQLGSDEVDHRSDLWAIGILLYEMLAGKHPLEPVSHARLLGAAAALDQPMPSIGAEVAGLPDRLVAIVDRCLAKRKSDRYSSAGELALALEPLLPARVGRSLVADESPYPGLHAFQEADATRFFGRAADIAAMIARLADHPLIGVLGPSGVGKSSFVRAGVVPALKSAGEPWETVIVRPGRSPLAALAGALDSLRDPLDSDPAIDADPVRRLRAEPGMFGARLRSRARRRRGQILVFVDQLEELYTLVADPAERRAFTACLASAADDPSGPLRVVVSMRSDFLDRAAEDRRFVEELTRGLVLLQPLARAGLEDALVQPLEMLGFSFDADVVPAMLDALEHAPGALPLLQFTAARLWEQRDKQRRVLTRASYEAIGGVAGALATHADEVLAAFSAPDQKLVREIFQRLVTPERTRTIVELDELREIAPAIASPIGRLVEARLLVVQTRREGERAVELVHESLIHTWPTLRRWLDESHDDEAYLAQLRAAAKQWDVKGRPQGLLWRGEAMQEARLWRARYPGELPAREQHYLDAVLALASRAARVRRRIAAGAFALLSVLVVAGGAALLSIERAEEEAIDGKAAADRARHDAEEARSKAEQATAETEKARAAAATRAKEAEDALAAKDAAEREAATAAARVRLANAKAETALTTGKTEGRRELLEHQEHQKQQELEKRITTGPLK
jgi:hypothetical protein